MEEFILRIGANATALKSELTRTGAWARAWGTTLAEDLKSKLGRMFAAGFILDKGMDFGREVLEKIKERILEIKHAEAELPGASSAFVQNAFNMMERMGKSFETISKPLLKFKQTLDAAKLNPAGEEMRMLERYKIVTGAADLQTQKFSTSLAKLSDIYLKSGKNLALLQDLMGKQALDPAMLALLGLGPKRIEAMDRFNPFSDFTRNTVDFFTGQFGAHKTMGQVITASLWNLMTEFQTKGMMLINPFVALNNMRLQKKGKELEAEEETLEKVEESIKRESERVAVQTKLLELKEKERELNATIADQGKVSLDQMASLAHRLSGEPTPRLFAITPRLREAMNIKDMETRAEIAFERGDDNLHDQLMKQAQAMRAAAPWMMDKDRNPMRKTESELDIIRQQLEPVKKMAEQVNKDSAQ